MPPPDKQDLAALVRSHAGDLILKEESEAELAARLEREKTELASKLERDRLELNAKITKESEDAKHKRDLELREAKQNQGIVVVAVVMLVLITVVSAYVALHSVSPEDRKASLAILSGVGGGIAGYFAGKAKSK